MTDDRMALIEAMQKADDGIFLRCHGGDGAENHH